jgi:hypothetical protein
MMARLEAHSIWLSETEGHGRIRSFRGLAGLGCMANQIALAYRLRAEMSAAPRSVPASVQGVCFSIVWPIVRFWAAEMGRWVR